MGGSRFGSNTPKIYQHLRAGALASLVFTVSIAQAGPAGGDPKALERKAKEGLAKSLLKLSQSLDMKEAKNPDSKGQGGKDFDNNTGNSFLSNTTIHYYVQSTCQEWVGGQFCQQWLDPFIPEHGFGGDFSPLEGLVAQEWLGRRNQDSGNVYKIWEIQREGGGPNTDADGKLDLSGITDWRLASDVKRKVEQIGEQTAQRQISLTFDDSAKGQSPKDTLPNMEGLRLMASRWTKMMRNRLVSNLADMRVGAKSTEFLQTEDISGCMAYVSAMRSRQEQTRVEERLEPQAKLDPETLPLDLQQRYQQCLALRAASVRMINPQAAGGQVQEGDVEQERIDQWRTRVNIAMIDQVGVDPNSIPKPSNAPLTALDVSVELADFGPGGKMRRRKRMTNAQQLQAYNNNLEIAAVGMKEVAMRSSNIVDNSKHILKHKIKPGQYNAVRLNSLTAEMRDELKNTSMKRSGAMTGKPELQLEDNATQLALTGN